MKNTLHTLLRSVISFFQFFERQIGHDCWIRITTKNPEYTYFFGPFESRETAQEKLPGFVEDLRSENAQISACYVEWCTPSKLTIPGSHQPAQLMTDSR